MMHERPDGSRPERQLAAYIGTQLGLDMFPMPELVEMDYIGASSSGRVVSLWELKVRSCGSDQYPTVIVDAQKILALWRLSAAFGAPPYLAVGYGDGVVRYVDLTDLPWPLAVRVGGRSDRGDPRDREPVAHIAVELFRVLT